MKDNSMVQVIEFSRYFMVNRLLNELCVLIDGKDFDKNVDKSL